jgi:transcriptional regulator with XRE-family HTH domain
MENIGTKVKEMRKKHGLTLTELSEKTELSVGFLSNLERGQTSQTISALHTVCNALDITLNDIISDIDDEATVSDTEVHGVSMIRHDERLPLFDQDNGNLHYDAMPNGNSSIKCTCMTIKSKEIIPFEPHNLDELGIIAQGSLELITDDGSYFLYPGDSIVVKAGTMHSGRCTSNEPCISYWIKCRK